MIYLLSHERQKIKSGLINARASEYISTDEFGGEIANHRILYFPQVSEKFESYLCLVILIYPSLSITFLKSSSTYLKFFDYYSFSIY